MSVEESVIGKSIVVKLFSEAAMKIGARIFYEPADGDVIDINTKVWFRYTSAAGHPVIEMEVAI